MGKRVCQLRISEARRPTRGGVIGRHFVWRTVESENAAKFANPEYIYDRQMLLTGAVALKTMAQQPMGTI
jgi:hypothetical protein